MTVTAAEATPTYDEWMRLAAEEYRRLEDLLRDLDPQDWTRQTDCDAWDVRRMVAHLVGAAESTASVREMARQGALGARARAGRDFIDGVNDVQVREREGRAPAELLADLVDAGRRGVAARSRLPRLLAAVPLPFGPPLGVRPLGYLMGRIYTRDEWMHRIDIAVATGRGLVLTPEHDGRLVADVVAEWAAAHGAAYDLVLAGPAGGRWHVPGGPRLELDAVEFVRAVAGRVEGAGLLAHRVPF